MCHKLSVDVDFLFFWLLAWVAYVFFSCKHWTLSQTLWHTSTSLLSLCKATPCLFFPLTTNFFLKICLIYFLFILCIFAQRYCIDLWYVYSHFTSSLMWCIQSRDWCLLRGRAGVQTKPCASRDLTRLAIFLQRQKKFIKRLKKKKKAYTTTWMDNQKCTKCALWRLATLSPTLGIKVAIFFFLFVLVFFYTCVIILAHVTTVPRLTHEARAQPLASSVSYNIRLFAINVHCKKKKRVLLLVYCTQRLSFYSCADLTPFLDCRSFFVRSAIMLERPSLTWVTLCFIS